jgi:hypothetical protein
MACTRPAMPNERCRTHGAAGQHRPTDGRGAPAHREGPYRASRRWSQDVGAAQGDDAPDWSGSAKTVEATLAQWLGFQVGRATWPLTTARAPKTPLSPC